MSDEFLCENYAGTKLIKFTFLILMTDGLKTEKKEQDQGQPQKRKTFSVY